MGYIISVVYFFRFAPNSSNVFILLLCYSLLFFSIFLVLIRRSIIEVLFAYSRIVLLFCIFIAAFAAYVVLLRNSPQAVSSTILFYVAAILVPTFFYSVFVAHSENLKKIQSSKRSGLLMVFCITLILSIVIFFCSSVLAGLLGIDGRMMTGPNLVPEH